MMSVLTSVAYVPVAIAPFAFCLLFDHTFIGYSMIIPFTVPSLGLRFLSMYYYSDIPQTPGSTLD